MVIEKSSKLLKKNKWTSQESMDVEQIQPIQMNIK